MSRAWGRYGGERGAYRVLVENLRGKDLSEDPDISGRIILRWIFRKWNVGEWIGSIWLSIGTGGGHL
jgi:hypothetical protein